MRLVLFSAVTILLWGCGGKTSNVAGGGVTDAGVDVNPKAPVTLISGQQEPVRLASDGTTLFWTHNGQLSSMPVEGGPVHDLGDASPWTYAFVFVDASNVYFQRQDGFYSMPKGGGSAMRITDTGAQVVATSISGSTALWAELVSQGPGPASVVAVKSAPAQGGPTSLVGQFSAAMRPTVIAATASATYVALQGAPIVYVLPNEPSLDGGMPSTLPYQCAGLTADIDHVYCGPLGGDVLAIASDGSTVALAKAASNVEAIALDATSAYWGNYAGGGGVLEAPKLGGTPLVLAGDTLVQDVAVDDSAVYWESQGNIKRLLK